MIWYFIALGLRGGFYPLCSPALVPVSALKSLTWRDVFLLLQVHGGKAPTSPKPFRNLSSRLVFPLTKVTWSLDGHPHGVLWLPLRALMFLLDTWLDIFWGCLKDQTISGIPHATFKFSLKRGVSFPPVTDVGTAHVTWPSCLGPTFLLSQLRKSSGRFRTIPKSSAVGSSPRTTRELFR